MSITVTIPLFALRRGQTSGIESAIFNLMRGFVSVGTELRVAAAKRSALPETIEQWLTHEGIPILRYPGLGEAMSMRFFEETLFGLMANAEHVLSPNYFLPARGPRLGQRSVIIHDLQHKVFPENFGPRKTRWLDWQYERTVREADLTIFISAFELNQARRYLRGVDERRVAVIPNAIDWSRLERGVPSASARAAAELPFVLSVAQNYPHKRLALLIRAFGEVARTNPACRLLIAGRASDSLVAMTRHELGEKLAERVRFLGFVSDADLGYLYTHAALFALPSAYEGFGMPAVEAMGMGCRTLVTDTTALPEVTLSRAHYLPLEAKEGVWAEELASLLQVPRSHDPALAREIRARYDPAQVGHRFALALGG